MDRKGLVIAAALATLFIARAYSQSFTANPSATTVAVGQRFQISFTFAHEDISGLSGFRAPDFRDFQVISGPNSSQSVSIVNGVMSAKLSYVYYLVPRAEGTVTVGAASVNYRGETYRTKPFTVTVQAGSPGGGSRPAPRANQPDRPQSVEDEIEENLFIRAFVDKRDVWKGEQATVTYKMYTRLSFSQPHISKLPTYQGFWAEEIATPSNVYFDREQYQGRSYNAATLRRAALFPTRSGELTVTPFEMEVPVQIRDGNNQGLFNDPFFSRVRTVDHVARSNRVVVNVKPLPETDLESFKGAVGEFSMKVEFDKTEVKRNEPITIRVTISGSGNIKLVQSPDVVIPPGFERYDPQIDERITAGTPVRGTKTFEYLIVPRRSGEKEIPGIEFTYFDLSEERYRTITSKPTRISIQQASAEPTEDFSKREVETLDRDIRFIKTESGSFSEIGARLYERWFFWALVGVPLLALIGAVIWRRRADELAADVGLLRLKRAEKTAKKRLKLAEESLGKKNHAAFYHAIANAITGYLCDKKRVPLAEFTIDDMIERLHADGVPPPTLKRLKETFERCEFARFAPGALGDKEAADSFDAAKNLIVEIDQALAARKRRNEG
ncbi:MAG: hypothetical protein GF419_05130 [Ignavibacteriales bacterium]|nr:hypothetical protein [Ignavibacteriales bacterium]